MLTNVCIESFNSLRSTRLDQLFLFSSTPNVAKFEARFESEVSDDF